MEQPQVLSTEEIGQMKIAYRSDFKLTMESDAGWHLPFIINFWTAGAPARKYVASYDGETWTNCRIDDINDQKLIIAFDDHHLGIGQLMCEIHYTLVDQDFPTTLDDEILQPMAVISTDEYGRKNYVILNLEGETAVDIIFVLPLIAQEQYRINNENERIAQERIRQQNELERQGNERQRVEAESQREVDFEAAQKAHQDAYDEAEKTRNNTFSTNENNRIQTFTDNEALRQKTFADNEALRQKTFADNEALRQKTFADNEALRQKTFADNEKNRQYTFDKNEAERKKNENERIANENARKSAETSRASAENLRVTAEEERQASFRAWGFSIVNGQLCQTYNN